MNGLHRNIMNGIEIYYNEGRFNKFPSSYNVDEYLELYHLDWDDQQNVPKAPNRK